MKDIRGRYHLPDGEFIDVHFNVAVNMWKNGNWMGYEELSIEEFEAGMEEMSKQCEVRFEPLTNEN
ncbi:hypothetical protein [Xanthomonas phage BUDD]|nr:hypothetical protein [Xanthomonas phage BUDD]